MWYQIVKLLFFDNLRVWGLFTPGCVYFFSLVTDPILHHHPFILLFEPFPFIEIKGSLSLDSPYHQLWKDL